MGFALAADVVTVAYMVTVAYILWSVWLLAFGIALLWRTKQSGALQTPDSASGARP